MEEYHRAVLVPERHRERVEKFVAELEARDEREPQRTESER